MNCMKCGVEIPENQVFCDHCLSLMEQYPVKPGTHVQLPKRAQVTESAKKPVKKKRIPSLEEQIAGLKLKVLRQRLAIAILVFALCLVSSFLSLKLYRDFTASRTGRNYTIDTSMNR